MGEVDMSASMAVRRLKESTQRRSQSIGLALVSEIVASVGMQMWTFLTSFRPRPHRAKTGEKDTVLFYAVQEYLRKPHRAVETL